MDSPTFCFSCGQPVTDPPRLNRLKDGSACPACRERALDAAPPILPFQRRQARPVEPYGELASQDWPFDERPEPA